MPSALDRRQFLQLAGASALAGLIPTRTSAISGPGLPQGSLRVAVLREPGFPAEDAPTDALAVVGRAVEGMEAAWLGAAELARQLSPERFDVLVTPYGSAFPQEAWPALLGYLEAGGRWVNVGGVPCAVRVERTAEGGWRSARDGARSRELGIVLSCAVSAAPVAAWRANDDLPWAAPLAAGLAPNTVWEPYWRLSSVADTPEESGSAGPREAAVRPIVSGLDAAGGAVAAPLVLVDRLERRFAGGRWILVTGDGAVPAETLRALVGAAALGPRDFAVRPSLACYRGRERPAVAVSLRAFPRAVPAALRATCSVEVADAAGAVLARVSLAVSGTEAEASGAADLGASLPDPLPLGLYRLSAVLSVPGALPELRHTGGFWVWDETLLGSGAPLVPDGHAFTRRGEPYPVTGTTYMASDAHRKFLERPNPWLWDRDFAAMKAAGVNLVRTGIWTGWKAMAPKAGEMEEGSLRALDAWLLTARRHDVPVIFTLFAFLPETWGGENPYLDPVAVAAQRAFVGLLARRYAAMRDLMWDLINEPSFCNKDHLWSCRPNYDRFERAAWSEWLKERRPDAAAAELPPLDDFGEGDHAPDHPTLVVEYRLFAQEMFRRWVREMRAALREGGRPPQLLTVGQDEAGTRDSPNNLLMAPDLDFTCVHTWWLNDALVWDEVLTKAPGRTNLVEETGVMLAAHPPGVETRWEEYARNLLERKLAVALGPGGAGFVEWVWNSNCYMPSDNEAAIGLLRADGTPKPELAALTGVAEFVSAARQHLVGREGEPVLLVVPHTNMFGARITATDATRRAVRAMQYGCRTGLAAVSEYAVAAGMEVPRLVLVPSPGELRTEAWDALGAWARRGAVVLVTGSLAQLEPFASRAAVGPSGAVRLPMGRGEILWAPGAVELASDDGAAVALYRWALARAGVTPRFDVDGADASVLVHAAFYRGAVLFTLVSEKQESSDLSVGLGGAGGEHDVVLPGERAALLLVRRRDGAVLASYQPR